MKKINYTEDLKWIRTLKDVHFIEDNFRNKKIICLWASGSPKPCINLFLNLRYNLIKKKYTVLMLIESNGIDLLRKYKFNEENQNDIYICDRLDLIQQIKDIVLLISNEYSMRQKCVRKDLKVAIIPHDIEFIYPNAEPVSLSADYILGTLNINKEFNYNFYPNDYKYTFSKTLTIFSGYLKLDLLNQKTILNENKINHRVAFYPTLVNFVPCSYEKLYNEYINLIKMFFQEFPEWEFILRPRKEDIYNKLYINIYNSFKNNKKFIFDKDSDNYHFLSRSDIIITDYSSIFLNFVYSTFKPSIRLKADKSIEQNYLKDKYGYITSNAKQTIFAIHDSIKNFDLWKKELKSLSLKEIPNLGNQCNEVINNIHKIINNEIIDGWIQIDKGNTPCNSISDYLKLLKISVSSNNIQRDYPVPLLELSIKKFGFDIKIGLAAIRTYILLWPEVEEGATIKIFYSQIQLAFSFVSPHMILKLLSFLYRKYGNKASIIFYAEAIYRWSPKYKDIFNIITPLNNKNLDFYLNIIFKKLLKYLKDHILSNRDIEVEIIHSLSTIKNLRIYSHFIKDKSIFIDNIHGGFDYLTSSIGRESGAGYRYNTWVRARAIIFALQTSLNLHPILSFCNQNKEITGLGISDDTRYSKQLEYKFSYKNTFYEREPHLDIMLFDDNLTNKFNFIICSDVLEHIMGDYKKALLNLYNYLKINGVLIFSVPYTFSKNTYERYPECIKYETLGDSKNRYIKITNKNGECYYEYNPIFHGGSGNTLEMRVFSYYDIIKTAKSIGFKIKLFKLNIPRFGIYGRQNESGIFSLIKK